MDKSTTRLDILKWNTSRSLWQLPVSSAAEREKTGKGTKEVHIVTDRGIEAFITYGYRQLRWIDRTTLFAIEALYSTKWSRTQLKIMFDGFYQKRLDEVRSSKLAKRKGAEAIAAEAEYLALLDLSENTEIRVTYADLAGVVREPRGVPAKHARDGSYVSDSVKALALTTLGQGTHTIDGQGKTRYWSSPVPLLKVKIGADIITQGSVITGDIVISLNAFHLSSILDGNAHQQEIRLVMSIRSPLAGHLYCYLRSALWKSSREKKKASIKYGYQDFAKYAQITSYRTPNEIRKQLREAYEELIEKGLATGFEVLKTAVSIDIDHHMDPKYLDLAVSGYGVEEIETLIQDLLKWQADEPKRIEVILRNVEWLKEYAVENSSLRTKEGEIQHEIDKIRYLRWYYVRRVSPKTYVKRLSGINREPSDDLAEKKTQ